MTQYPPVTMYLYLRDSSANADTPIRNLTPRAWFYAKDRAEARQRFLDSPLTEQVRREGFGKAAFRQVTKREMNRTVMLDMHLPELSDLEEAYFSARA